MCEEDNINGALAIFDYFLKRGSYTMDASAKKCDYTI